jgi:hypothetical protein
VAFKLTGDMASALPLSTSEPSGQGGDVNGDATVSCHVGPLKQAEQYGQTTEFYTPACESTAPEAGRNHDSSTGDDLKGLDYSPIGLDQKIYVDHKQDRRPHHVRKESGHCKVSPGWQYGQWLMCLPIMVACAFTGADSQDWTWALAMAPYASTNILPRSCTRVLAFFAMIACTNARALPPYRSAQSGQESDTAISSDAIEAASVQNSDSDLNTHGARWITWVTLFIISVGVAGGAEACVYFRRERSRQIRVMVNVGVLTLVIAAVPMIFHQAGGIEAELNGPLWALWAGAHVNFVLRGALLLRNDQAGYLSPLGYVAVLAVLSHLVFFTADKPNSRLYTTLTTFAVTVLQDVGLRAFFGDA